MKRIGLITLVVILSPFVITADAYGVPNRSPEPSHDVAVTNMSAPSSCAQGDIVPLIVTVENQGNCRESFNVTFTDTTRGKEIGTKSVHLSLAGVQGIYQTCDLIFNSPASGTNVFGNRMSGQGDVNGDGYDDLLITAPEWNNLTGRTYLYYGGANMDAIPDRLFNGEHAGDYLCGCALGDVNNDNYSDVILGAKGYNNQGRVYIYFGGPDWDQNVDLILEGEVEQGAFGQLIDTGDVDNDGYEDVLVTAPCVYSRKGRAYLYYGGDPMDANCDGVFEGENAGDYFGRSCIIGEDVDGDNYREILIGARYFPGHNPEQGRAYLYYGNNKANMDTTCDVVFTCPEFGRKNFGCSIGIFDVDTDGYAEVIIGARFAYNYRGRVYLYWGDKRANMDAIPDKIFTGEKDGSPNLGGDTLYCGYFNKDKYGDIAIGAYNWNRLTGRVYVYYGGTKTLMDTIPDKIFSGVLGSAFGCEVSGGDFNNDNYTDIVAGGWNYNNREGRAWLYYGSPGDSTEVKFDWDTTKAPTGEHTLKAEIVPVAREEDTADNTKTITVNVKSKVKEK